MKVALLSEDAGGGKILTHTHTKTSFGRILMSEEAEILNVENEKNTVLGWGAENRGRQDS